MVYELTRVVGRVRSNIFVFWTEKNLYIYIYISRYSGRDIRELRVLRPVVVVIVVVFAAVVRAVRAVTVHGNSDETKDVMREAYKTFVNSHVRSRPCDLRKTRRKQRVGRLSGHLCHGRRVHTNPDRFRDVETQTMDDDTRSSVD